MRPSSWRGTGERIARFEPDVVIFQWWQPFFGEAYRAVIRQVRRSSKAPVLFLCHNVYSHGGEAFPGRKMIESVMIRRTFRWVDGFLVQARELVDAVRSFKPAAEVRTIHHPVYDFYTRWDYPEEPRLSTRMGMEDPPTAGPSLLFFGKIRQYKGLKTLVEAMALLPPELNCRLVVAGEFYVEPGPYKRLAERLKVDSRIVWMDRYIPNEEVPRLFRAADLVVLPYVEATQSGVVPVAYQFGVPVVATSVGGLGEVIQDGRTGYLVPPSDPVALAGAISRFFQENRSRDFREKIEQFRPTLSWRHVVETIEELAVTLGVQV